MIKIKITNKHNKYEYEPLRRCFSGLVRANNMLHDYSIQLVTNGSYDYEFIDKNCFMDRHKTMQQSVDDGLEYLSTISGDYFLFDGGDDSSLVASYDVFINSNAKGLFRHQLLSRDDYKVPMFLGRWFDTDQSNKMHWDIPDTIWNRIHLSGYNLGHAHPHLTEKLYKTVTKDIDVVGIWQGEHKYNIDYGVENYKFYTMHRTTAWDVLNIMKDKYNIVTGQYDTDTTHAALSRAKIGVSPFGQGELCFRDFEIVQHGALLIKPDISKVHTLPNWLVPYETYIPCKADWSDLTDIIENILGNYQNYQYIIDNARNKMIESYKLEHTCMYWYNFFKNYDSIGYE
jgi:hypothetical protein